MRVVTIAIPIKRGLKGHRSGRIAAKREWLQLLSRLKGD